MSFARSIGFLGAGNMAGALLRGLVKAEVAPSLLRASAPRSALLSTLSAEIEGIGTTTDNRELARSSEIIVLAVKPQILGRVLAEIADSLEHRPTVVSIAAGVPISAIEKKLPSGIRVIRSMPNTPARVGAGATAIAPGTHANAEDLECASFIFNSVGMTITVEEEQLDAVTGLSGSGPAYIFLILEALADAGVKVGLSRRNAQRLAAQTVMGSAKLLLDTDGHPGQLKDMVTSPGGTAIAGLHTLEEGGMRTTLINAVESATRRAGELGERYQRDDDS